jgi:uncharacterized protein
MQRAAERPPSRTDELVLREEPVSDTLALPATPSMKPHVVKCPQCGTAVSWSPDSKWRPFCSERCKLIDIGAWASERYRVETPESPDPNGVPPDASEDS